MSGTPAGQRQTLNAGAVAYLREVLADRRRMFRELAEEAAGNSEGAWAWHSGADEALRQMEGWLDLMRDHHADWPEDWTAPEVQP